MPRRWATFFAAAVGRVAVVVLLLALASGETAYGQSAEQQRDSLAGIGSVRVIIQPLSENGKAIGLREDGLKALVELQLRRNGVPVTELPDSSFLYVNVLVLDRDTPIVSTISVALRQRVIRLANRRSQFATTWEAAITARRSSADRTRDFIRDTISEEVDVFSNDYLAVNPQP